MSKKSQSDSAENQLKVMKVILAPTLAVGVISLIGASLHSGLPGFLGAALAQAVVLIYVGIHLLIARLSHGLDPVTTMSLAMFSYFAKLVALGLFLCALTALTSEESIDRLIFGLSAVAATLTWLGGEVASFLRLKTHLPLPDERKP